MTITTHIHFCPACNCTWEHDNKGCDKQTERVRCEKCEKTAHIAARTSVMYER